MPSFNLRQNVFVNVIYAEAIFRLDKKIFAIKKQMKNVFFKTYSTNYSDHASLIYKTTLTIERIVV